MQTLRRPAVRHSLLIFIGLRLFLTVWAVVALAASPLPDEPDETLRPYLDQPILDDGLSGLLLGPWQRFDALHYTRIAADGYANESDSVFPPLYPLGIRLLGELCGSRHADRHAAYMAAAILLANAALLGLLVLLHHVVTAEIGAEHAPRALIYFVLFPTGFFLFAPYSESLFLLLSLASIWSARNGRFARAGLLGFLAALTRLTGWVLTIPLAYELWRQWRHDTERSHPVTSSPTIAIKGRPHPITLAWTALPALGSLAFFGYRWAIGLPPLSDIYRQYWFQTTNIPGGDLQRALQSMFFGGPARAGELTLWFDFGVTLLLIVTTVLTFRRLGRTWGLYSTMLLLFMLLPTSELKPLYSFSRYALAFFPTFMLLGLAGKRPWIHRLILYSSLALYLYFSGQFFIWGWVA